MSRQNFLNVHYARIPRGSRQERDGNFRGGAEFLLLLFFLGLDEFRNVFTLDKKSEMKRSGCNNKSRKLWINFGNFAHSSLFQDIL